MKSNVLNEFKSCIKNLSWKSIGQSKVIAPPKKPKNNESKKGRKKKKKNKNKIVHKTVRVDNKAIDSEWWDIFWNKNSSTSGNHFLFFFSINP